VAVTEGRAVDPGLERVLVLPAGDDQPREPIVGRLEELEALEPRLAVDRARPGGEAPRQLVAGVLGDGDGVDLDDLCDRSTLLVLGPGQDVPTLASSPDLPKSADALETDISVSTNHLVTRGISGGRDETRWSSYTVAT
jgi:hypothetical protein